MPGCLLLGVRTWSETWLPTTGSTTPSDSQSVQDKRSEWQESWWHLGSNALLITLETVPRGHYSALPSTLELLTLILFNKAHDNAKKAWSSLGGTKWRDEVEPISWVWMHWGISAENRTKGSSWAQCALGREERTQQTFQKQAPETRCDVPSSEHLDPVTKMAVLSWPCARSPVNMTLLTENRDQQGETPGPTLRYHNSIPCSIKMIDARWASTLSARSAAERPGPSRILCLWVCTRTRL